MKLGFPNDRHLPKFFATAGTFSSFLIPAAFMMPILLLLAFSPCVASVQFTWDFAFLLSGAWHLYWRHIPFVDFGTVVGILSYLPTTVSMAVFGLSVKSFIIGQAAFSFIILVLASYVCHKRVSRITAVVFVISTSLLMVLPSALGDGPNDFSHAMSYNRYGWALISVLALHLFLPASSLSSSSFSIAQQIVAFLIVFGLFHVKITYFMVALGLLIVWVVFDFNQARKARILWYALSAFFISIPLISWHLEHVKFVWYALRHGGGHTIKWSSLNILFGNIEVFCLAGAFMLVIWILSRSRIQAIRDSVLFFSLCLSGYLLLSQNWGNKFIPLIVAAFLIQYERIRQELVLDWADSKKNSQNSVGFSYLGKNNRMSPLLMAAAVAFVYPIAILAYNGGQTLWYLQKIYRAPSGRMLLLDSDDVGLLSGLTVPKDSDNILVDIGQSKDPMRLLSRERKRRPKLRIDVTQEEYMYLVQDGMRALKPIVQPTDRILSFMNINPFPFALGVEPLKNETTWFGNSGTPIPTDWEALLSEATILMEPKLSFLSYRPQQINLDDFAVERDTNFWRIYKRVP